MQNRDREEQAAKRLKELQAKVKSVQDEAPRMEQQMANARAEA